MSTYTKQNIANSQLRIGGFLTEKIVNRLIHLFDENSSNKDPVHNMVAYIQEEHERRQINTTGIRIICLVKGHMKIKPDPICIAEIQYNGSPLVHLTIHLAPEKMSAKHYGMIHLVKNHYQNQSQYDKLKDRAHLRLYVTIPPDKPNSLLFEIADGLSPPSKGNTSLEPLIQQELQVLLTVLNKVFDETDIGHYIGNYSRPNKLVNMNAAPPIRTNHPNTPRILSLMNRQNVKITRKNKGVAYVPLDSSLLNLSVSSSSRSSRPSLRRTMRKKQRRGIPHKSR